MSGCRGCGKPDLTRVLDLGKVPAADYFPQVGESVGADEAAHGLAMDLCVDCGLAQLADDDTVTEEPRGVEPQALKDQARAAIEQVDANGWLRGDTVIEFGSPHGGTWIPLLTERGFHTGTATADIVLDCFGIMHEPDQRDAFSRRANVMRPEGVLLLQYHSLVTIVQQKQWNALRHGHFAYYSMSSLTQLLAVAGMRIATAWEFDLYGGTVLCAAVRGDVAPDESVLRILDSERALGAMKPDFAAALQHAADQHVKTLRRWLEDQARESQSIYAYGAASRAVALFSRAGIDSSLLAGVADASPAKQGRRMPGTDIPIVSPDELLAADPDRVLLTLPDLLPEVSARYPQLAGRWKVDAP
jgi:C-methyltransferase C-terminal domain/Putative zinc binding domain